MIDRLRGWLNPKGNEYDLAASVAQYMDTVVQGNVSYSRRLASIEASIAFIVRCMTGATIIGVTLEPGFIARLTRQLLTAGESIWHIDNGTGVWRFSQADSAEIQGAPNEDSWTYTMQIVGPSQTVQIKAASASVLHFRYATEASAPWQGLGPLQLAGVSVELASKLEGSLRDMAGLNTQGLITYPTGIKPSDLNNIKNALAAGRGKTNFAPAIMPQATMVGGAPPASQQWDQRRIGPTYDVSEPLIRDRAEDSIMGAFGVPPQLIGGGPEAREDLRRFLHTTLVPLSVIIMDEFERKLNRRPKFDFSQLFASDIQGRARAFGSLVTAGLTGESAMKLTGLDGEMAEVEEVEVEPDIQPPRR